jgi:hypothetical protein
MARPDNPAQRRYCKYCDQDPAQDIYQRLMPGVQSIFSLPESFHRALCAATIFPPLGRRPTILIHEGEVQELVPHVLEGSGSATET